MLERKRFFISTLTPFDLFFIFGLIYVIFLFADADDRASTFGLVQRILDCRSPFQVVFFSGLLDNLTVNGVVLQAVVEILGLIFLLHRVFPLFALSRIRLLGILLLVFLFTHHYTIRVKK